VESLDRVFENVCELDLVFHFDEVRHLVFLDKFCRSYRYHKVHHILAEIIQGGLVLETNVDEIDSSSVYLQQFFPPIWNFHILFLS
jgi:AP-3 complex subunit sigma